MKDQVNGAVAKPRATLYWAYGSNLNKAQMRERCPRAKAVSKLYLPGGRLIFRGVADVDLDCEETRHIGGGLWRITPRCEEVLDRFEGFPGFYRKCYLTLRLKDEDGEWLEPERAMFYVMNRPDSDRPGVHLPWEKYYETIRQGYEDFGLDTRLLQQALEDSELEADKTPDLYERWVRKGRPSLVDPREKASRNRPRKRKKAKLKNIRDYIK